jgi:HAD superfamily hydrolase (TIGR01509 family)
VSETGAVCLDAFGTLFVLTPRIGPRIAALTGVDAAEAARVVDEAGRETDWAIDWAEPGHARETWRAFFADVASRLGVRDPPALVAALESVPFDPSAYAAFPDAGPALRTLRARGLRLGVVSNGDRAVEAILERLDLRPLLDEVVVSAEVGAGKPDPAIFEHALTRLGAPAGEAVYAGDDPVLDVAAAEAAGLTGVLVDRDGLAPDFPGRRVSDLLELCELVRA